MYTTRYTSHGLHSVLQECTLTHARITFGTKMVVYTKRYKRHVRILQCREGERRRHMTSQSIRTSNSRFMNTLFCSKANCHCCTAVCAHSPQTHSSYVHSFTPASQPSRSDKSAVSTSWGHRAPVGNTWWRGWHQPRASYHEDVHNYL